MTVKYLEEKMAQITAQIEQSVANHHVLLGSRMAFESMLAEVKAAEAAPSEAVPSEAMAELANAEH